MSDPRWAQEERGEQLEDGRGGEPLGGGRGGARTEAPKSEPSRKPLLAVLGVLVVLGAAVGGWYLLRGKPAAPPAEPGAQPVATAPVEPAEKPSEARTSAKRLPALSESDAWVRELLGRLSSTREWATWLGGEELIRRFTTAVSSISEGESPRMFLPFLAPSESFEVLEEEGRTFIAPRSYRRYDTVARVISSLDAQGAAQAYRQMKPLIDGVYAELSRPGQRFEQTFARALRHLLDVPVPEEEVEVMPTAEGIAYVYAEPALEDLSSAQKHLLRMGPANIRAIQAKLRELQAALALPTAGR